MFHPVPLHLPLDEQLDDLVVVGVSGEHDGSNVRGELGELTVHHQRGNLQRKKKRRARAVIQSCTRQTSGGMNRIKLTPVRLKGIKFAKAVSSCGGLFKVASAQKLIKYPTDEEQHKYFKKIKEVFRRKKEN